MARHSTVIPLTTLLSIFVVLFSSATAYLLPNSHFARRHPQLEAFYAYRNRFENSIHYTHGRSDAFEPIRYFSNYFGNAHLWGGVPVENQYVCGMAYVKMKSGDKSYTGSGILISNYKILTAAHNFDEFTPLANVTVYMGDRDGDTTAPVAVRNIYRLSGYVDSSPRGGNDLAIIDLVNYQRSACRVMWQDRASVNPTDGDAVTFLGYGSINANRDGLGEGTLRQASLVIAENGHTVAGLPVCSEQTEVSQVICAVSPGYPARLESGTCASDSGGPLIKDDGTNKWVVGVNSYSDTRCDTVRNVDMFARVYPHRAVIEAIVYRGNTAGWTPLP